MDYRAYLRSMRFGGALWIALTSPVSLGGAGDANCRPATETEYCCPGIIFRSDARVYADHSTQAPSVGIAAGVTVFPVLEEMPGWIKTACAEPASKYGWVRTGDIAQAIRSRPLRLTTHDAALYQDPSATGEPLTPGAFVPLWQVGRSSDAGTPWLEVIINRPARHRYWIKESQTRCWRTRLAITAQGQVEFFDSAEDADAHFTATPADSSALGAPGADVCVDNPPVATLSKKASTVAGDGQSFFPVLDWQWLETPGGGRRVAYRVLVVSEPARAGFVFVVDTTESMKGRRKAIEETIKKCYTRIAGMSSTPAASSTARDAKKGPEERPRPARAALGLVAFRDRLDAQKPSEVTGRYVADWFIALDPSLAPALLNAKLTEMDYALETNQYDQEDALAGIRKALDPTEMKWELYRDRYLILITDAAARMDANATPQATKKGIVDALEEQGVTLHVLLFPSLHPRSYQAAVDDQYKALTKTPLLRTLDGVIDLVDRAVESVDSTVRDSSRRHDGFSLVATQGLCAGQTTGKRTQEAWIVAPAPKGPDAARPPIALKVMMSEAELDALASQTGRLARTLGKLATRPIDPFLLADRVPFAPPSTDAIYMDELDPLYLAMLPFPAGFAGLAGSWNSPSRRQGLQDSLKAREGRYIATLHNLTRRLSFSRGGDSGVWFLVDRQDLSPESEQAGGGHQP